MSSKTVIIIENEKDAPKSKNILLGKSEYRFKLPCKDDSWFAGLLIFRKIRFTSELLKDHFCTQMILFHKGSLTIRN